MVGSTKARSRAAVVAIAPAVMLVALVAHPDLGNFGDPGFFTVLATAVAANPALWAAVHFMTVVGSGLLVLAFLAIRSYLRAAGEERWSALAMPFIVMGSFFYAMLPTMELTLVAVAAAGADVPSVQRAIVPLFLPILVAGGIAFTIGAFGFSVGIVRSRMLSPRLTFAAGALVVMAVSRVAPVEVVQFYVQAVASIVALWPLAYVIWKHPEARTAGHGHSVPAS